ncbi:MAG: AAA family ATPase [Sarcina sp.]
MIINKIIIKDFFRYYGEQTIEYTNNDGKNVLVLIGENGRGKTTLLSAFSWALYGEVKKPLTVDSMLNDNKAKSLKSLEETEAFVSIEFIEDKTKYIVRRSQKFIKSQQGMINKVGVATSKFIRVKPNGVQEEIRSMDSFINNLIPKRLSGFFFFDGERIDRLAKIDGKKEIKQAILDMLGIDTIESGQKDLERVKRDLTQEIKKYSVSKEAKDLSVTYDEYCKTLILRQKQRKEIKEKIDLYEEIIQKCIKELRESNISEVRRLEQQETTERVFKEKAEKDLKEAEMKIKRYISENFKYYLLAKHHSYVINLLEERREKGQLPSDIRYTFVEDLLNNKECICGCKLEKGTEAFEKVEGLKENSGRPEFDEADIQIKGLIDDAKKNKGKNFKENLEVLNKKRLEFKNNIVVRENNIVNIKKKLSNIEVGDVAKIEARREEANKEKDRRIENFGQLNRNIQELERKIEILEKKIKQANSNVGAVKVITKKLDKLEKLIALNEEFKAFFTKLVREELDLKIKDVFSKITNKDYRVPVLTENFELKITSSLNETRKEVVLSTGEGQITSLSFIGALVSYAKENKNHEILSKFCASEYPIVMDSPFGNLDHIHTQNVAKNIGHLASQVIIIVSQKQWRGNVESNIKEQVSDCYFMSDGKIDATLNGEYTQIQRIGEL